MDKDTFFRKKRFINCGGKYLDLSTPRIMGILNTTPDSFFDGGKYNDAGSIIQRTDTIISDGADIVDIGAYSSRPGAENISQVEEWSRLSRALDIIRKKYPDTILSVDTFRAEIARKAVNVYGVQIINDISGGLLDPEMHDMVVSLGVPYIIMHMSGNPQNMQQQTDYTNVTAEVLRFLGIQAEKLIIKGVKDIIIDPGFGFGKTLNQNYELLSKLEIFKSLGFPLLVGLSRKSMISRFLNITPEESLTGTLVLDTIALMKGSDILRVHDVKETKQAVDLYTKTIEESKN
jgi:dihydropteroate synthase